MITWELPIRVPIPVPIQSTVLWYARKSREKAKPATSAINRVLIERESTPFLNQIIMIRKGSAYAILKKAPVKGFASDNAYKILEVKKTDSNEEIKKAYREMAKKHHPDKVQHLGEAYIKASQEKFQKIQKAYEKIKSDRGF